MESTDHTQLFLDTSRQPLRIDPNLPPPPISATSPRSYVSPSSNYGVLSLDNGIGRTTSRRRKVSGQSYARTPEKPEILPAAPDVPTSTPLGPPVSYRDPYANGEVLPTRTGSQRSFATRAGSFPESVDPALANSIAASKLPSLSNHNHSRNGSMNQHTDFNYPQGKRPVTSSFSSSNTPSFPQQSISRQTAPRTSNSDSVPNSAVPISSPIRSGSKRVSGGGVEPRAEWASDRSPLQTLEGKLHDISKEEKRARVQQAEQLLREVNAAKMAGQGSTKGNKAVTVRQSKPTSNGPTNDRHVSSNEHLSHEHLSHEHLSHEHLSHEHRNLPTSTDTHAKTVNHNLPRKSVAKESPSAHGILRGSSIHETSLEEKLVGLKDSSVHSQPNEKRRRSIGAPSHNAAPDRAVRFQSETSTGDRNREPQSPNAPMQGGIRNSKTLQESPYVDLSPNGTKRRSSLQSHPAEGTESRRTVSTQQQQLYTHKMDSPRTKNSADAFGGSPDPLPVHAARTYDHTLKYEVPPQTAAGIDARNRVDFGSGATTHTDTSTHHKHHFSAMLHRQGQGLHKSPDPSIGQSKQFSDWKQGGVARLTLEDIVPSRDKPTENNAWWESPKYGSNRRRSNSQNINDGFLGHDQGHEDGIGKDYPYFSNDSQVKLDPMGRVVRTRQYISQDRTQRVRWRNLLWLRQPQSILELRSTPGMKRVLTSSYSYSCPQLSEHDPFHIDHICKPYVSKELTRSMRSIRIRIPAVPTSFNPPLLLKCGPLLRYTGLKRDVLDSGTRTTLSASERETWRGSVMIVTVDSRSTYDPVPTLRLFHQPMNLLPPPPQQVDGSKGEQLPSEYVDPIAGLPKMSRTGSTVYVKPVEDLEEGVDVSRIENDDGLYEETRTANVPTSYGKADEFLGRSPLPVPGKNRSDPRADPRRSGRFREVQGVKLHAERGVTFWRFNLEVELGEQQARIAYSINKAASIGFWVPARAHTMNIMFHSCNGFSMSVNPADFSGPDPLWRDVLNSHQTKPFHVMIGGGDQIYNDAVMAQTSLFQEWLAIKNPHHKHEAQFTHEMKEELETFYLERYSMWFSQGLFGMANSQIPMINMWDDHDIIDGFGSYPHHFMSTPVFCGLGNIAFKYYMLFQHQSVADETSADEPSWLFGASPGPYINELSRSVFVSLGKHVAFVGLDCRTERMRDEILSEESYELIFDRCRREIDKGVTKHLIVLLGVPIAYPRLVWLENILTSRVMDPIKAIGRMGLMGSFINKFDGGVEILDDLDDHWTAKNHKHERNWFIQELQSLAADKSVRVTILGGDVHLAAVGQFYSNPKLRIPKDKDHRYMPNVISSAIVNTPPPEMMGDILNKRNKVHHLDHETDEDMIPMFTYDVDGKLRNNKRLLPRRNWCSISEYQPGSTPPPTPPLSSSGPSEESLQPQPRNRLQRTFSLTHGDSKPANLFRRLSQRAPPSPEPSPADQYRPSSTKSHPIRPFSDDQLPIQAKLPTAVNTNGASRGVSAPLPFRPISTFHRRPTNLSEQAAAKGGTTTGEINLEYGLDIVLNCEVSQRDPAGCTVPYRLLVPTLWYEDGSVDIPGGQRKESWLQRFGSRRSKKGLAERQGAGEWGGGHSDSESDFGNERQGTGKFEAQERLQSESPSIQKLPHGAAFIGVNGNGDVRRPVGVPPGWGSPTMGDREEPARQRLGSKFDANGNSNFFGTNTQIHGGGGGGGKIGGGYGGIEAYKDKEKGWRRLFSRE